jgi:hypothetical protein
MPQPVPGPQLSAAEVQRRPGIRFVRLNRASRSPLASPACLHGRCASAKSGPFSQSGRDRLQDAYHRVCWSAPVAPACSRVRRHTANAQPKLAFDSGKWRHAAPGTDGSSRCETRPVPRQLSSKRLCRGTAYPHCGRRRLPPPPPLMVPLRARPPRSSLWWALQDGVATTAGASVPAVSSGCTRVGWRAWPMVVSGGADSRATSASDAIRPFGHAIADISSRRRSQWAASRSKKSSSPDPLLNRPPAWTCQ